jgi:predicted ArsR family transcriptional regulator
VVVQNRLVDHDDRSDERRRHQALAGISRSRLLAVLRRSNAPMDIRELAAAVDLHPNTAREHLDRLVAAGLVVRGTAAPAGRGRPGLRYAAAPTDGVSDPAGAYRALASVLVVELSGRPDVEEAARSAGERWGAQAAGQLGTAGDAEAALDRLVGVLDQLGFSPERSAAEEPSLMLHRCPFRPLALEHAEVVCGVHLGLLRGALRAMGAPLDAVGLDPFVEPDLCRAHLAAKGAHHVEPWERA